MPPRGKLEPGLKVVTDKIYNRDRKRYARLILWVWRQQKIGWSNGAIRQTLELCDKYLDDAPDWWRYLTKLLPKGAGRASEQKHEEYKTEVGMIANEFVEFLKLRQPRKKVG